MLRVPFSLPTRPPPRPPALSVSMAAIAAGGVSQEGQHQGSLVLRHYYLGKARAKCLESAITSVPVALREVSAICRPDY